MGGQGGVLAWQEGGGMSAQPAGGEGGRGVPGHPVQAVVQGCR